MPRPSVVNEAANPFLCGALHGDHDDHGDGDEQKVAEPGVELRDVQAVENVRLMDEVPQVKVQNVKTVTCLSNDGERVEAEEARDEIVSGEAEDGQPK